MARPDPPYAATEHVTRLLEDDVLTHPVAARHPLTAAGAAHRDAEPGHAVGKVLILP
ncbi:zinc-binding dehydrogenase [Nonomuraea sp. B12E4]|uniref:zinc-binding dehydrogenase n=1 Tax=Nonomuraea sp. B12E4 TaxID=3153564 RepID=UPI00325C91D3